MDELKINLSFGLALFLDSILDSLKRDDKMFNLLTNAESIFITLKYFLSSNYLCGEFKKPTCDYLPCP